MPYFFRPIYTTALLHPSSVYKAPLLVQLHCNLQRLSEILACIIWENPEFQIHLMSLQILHKQLDESTPCPLCQAAMFWVDAEQYDKEINFHECSHCQHRVFSNSNLNCHCDSCLAQRKKILKETRQQEQRKTKTKDIWESTGAFCCL